MNDLQPLSQEIRELAQALRVQTMPDDQRDQWMVHEWGRAQRQAGLFRLQLPPHQPGARSFATLDEKNAFDEARELAFAMRHSVFATTTDVGQHEATRTRP